LAKGRKGPILAVNRHKMYNIRFTLFKSDIICNKDLGDGLLAAVVEVIQYHVQKYYITTAVNFSK
jgi:hypothetical protein